MSGSTKSLKHALEAVLMLTRDCIAALEASDYTRADTILDDRARLLSRLTTYMGSLSAETRQHYQGQITELSTLDAQLERQFKTQRRALRASGSSLHENKKMLQGYLQNNPTPGPLNSRQA